MNNNGPIYSMLTGKPTLFTGFAREVNARGGSIGVLQWPATWSNTSNSFTITNNPNTAFDHLFTLSGNSGSISSSNSSSSSNYYYSPRIRSTAQNGGGTLDKGGYYEYGGYPTYWPSSLNAGSYWVITPNPAGDSGYPTSATVTLTFANAVLTSAKPRASFTDHVQFTPAAQVSVSGLVTSFTVYSNAEKGSVFFTVPAGSARSVTIADTRVAYTGSEATLYNAITLSNKIWDSSTAGVGCIRSLVDYSNSGWYLDKNGGYSSPYTGASNTPGNFNYYRSVTMTLNPGNYLLELRRSRYSGGYTGTITIT